MGSTTPCDHTSVGAVILDRKGNILMFERGTPPWGIAGPSGHCDGDTYEQALRKEVSEEVGLQVTSARLIATFQIKKACRRAFATTPYHDWQFFVAEVTGEIHASVRETRNVRWYSPEEIEQLIGRTEQYLWGMLSEEEWKQNPGLDLSWYRLFTREAPQLLKEWSKNADERLCHG